MINLTLIGIGSGNPDHLTGQAVAALNAADLVLIPQKGADKADLAHLRQAICTAVLTNPATRQVAFAMPERDAAAPYRDAVDAWHDAIASRWADLFARHLPQGGRAALMVWGDPSLYDSTLRIAGRLRHRGVALEVAVVPGLTSLQLLTAAHAVPLNTLAGAVEITTGRRLREQGPGPGCASVAVMLDGECSFAALPDPGRWFVWWGAYLGMAEQVLLAGPLTETGPQIVTTRATLRAGHGWIMDTYLLRRIGPDGRPEA